MGRQALELDSRLGAGIICETDDYYLVKVLNQFEMYVHKQDKSVTPCLVRDGFWESWITEYIRTRVGAGTVFFDIGANTGYYSLLAYACGAMVVSYEPNPVYHNMLQATLDYHGIRNGMFRLSNYAVSDSKGTEILYVPKELHGSASFTDMDVEWETTPVEVKTTNLSLKGCGYYMIKIDAEGAEEKIWDGMVDDLSRRIGPTEVLLEYTPNSYTPNFLAKLEKYSPLHWINHEAEAEPVTREWVEAQTDWVMLSVGTRFKRR